MIKILLRQKTVWSNSRMLLTAEQRRRPTQRNLWPIATRSITKFARSDPWSNTIFRGERPVFEKFCLSKRNIKLQILTQREHSSSPL